MSNEAAAVDVDAEMLPRKGFYIMHMNLDHELSLRAYANHYAKEKAERVILTDVDSRGMTLCAQLEKGCKAGIYVPFPEPLKSAGELRSVVVKMHQEAFAALGWVDPTKTWSGKLQHALHHAGTKTKVAAVVFALSTVVALSRRYRISRI
eukprot:TRINITY_DN14168_c0_g1_i2.p1 TRINITY_DN14168_c0_g1~~TRINITY_DN14168_c0_g1_i2.p1  ORF type:complete len:165 (+),score=14.50 TRINITY_DN14168_c0_g1_i2:48-497(+)